MWEPQLIQIQAYFQQEDFVFFFERQREAVDDGAEDLEQLCDAVVPLRLVHEPVEDVVDLLPDVSAKAQKFAVNPVKDLISKISLHKSLAQW